MQEKINIDRLGGIESAFKEAGNLLGMELCREIHSFRRQVIEHEGEEFRLRERLRSFEDRKGKDANA